MAKYSLSRRSFLGAAAVSPFVLSGRADPAFARVDFDRVLDQTSFVGRAPEQVDEFLASEVAPARERYQHLLGQTDEPTV